MKAFINTESKAWIDHLSFYSQLLTETKVHSHQSTCSSSTETSALS